MLAAIRAVADRWTGVGEPISRMRENAAALVLGTMPAEQPLLAY
jgi:hypothetical protein